MRREIRPPAYLTVKVIIAVRPARIINSATVLAFEVKIVEFPPTNYVDRETAKGAPVFTAGVHNN